VLTLTTTDESCALQLKVDLEKLDKEVTELENTLVSLFEEANHRGDNSGNIRLRPVAVANVGGDTRLVLVDSIWSELISPAGFPMCALTADGGSSDPPIVDLDQSVSQL
jgi:phosphate uptake regulator